LIISHQSKDFIKSQKTLSGIYQVTAYCTQSAFINFYGMQLVTKIARPYQLAEFVVVTSALLLLLVLNQQLKYSKFNNDLSLLYSKVLLLNFDTQ